jgi:hypothetical protein
MSLDFVRMFLMSWGTITFSNSIFCKTVFYFRQIDRHNDCFHDFHFSLHYIAADNICWRAIWREHFIIFEKMFRYKSFQINQRVRIEVQSTKSRISAEDGCTRWLANKRWQALGKRGRLTLKRWVTAKMPLLVRTWRLCYDLNVSKVLLTITYSWKNSWHFNCLYKVKNYDLKSI